MNRQLKRDILRLFALSIGLLLMVILLSGCRPTQILTDNNTETRDSIVQIRQTRDPIFYHKDYTLRTQYH